jgi:protein-S-isoprenylcysteine O-methyltransferase Ste14
VAIWTVAAFGLRKRRSLRQPLGTAAIWRLGAVVVVGLAYRLAGPVLDHLATDSWWVAIPGLVLLVASTAFAIWARSSLGAMWSLAPNVLKDHHELRTDGPYGITRHPIYTGLLGMLLGTALLSGLGFWIGLPVVGVAVFATRVHIEEGLMSRTFPEDYPRYRRRVPGLIPMARPARRRGGSGQARREAS